MIYFTGIRNLVAIGLLLVSACKPALQGSEISSAANKTTTRSRGECIAQFSGNTLRMSLKREFQGNMGRVHGNSMTYEEGLGFNYGDKNGADLLVTWCQRNDCVKVEPTQGFVQVWKRFAQRGEKKLSFELFPDRTPYEVKVTFGSEVHVAKCSQWDDK
jgi:hypothetical protein